jgi:hypothetical protein
MGRNCLAVAVANLKYVCLFTGFGFSNDIDDQNIGNVVKFLKEETKSITAFIFLFNGVEKRFTRTAFEWLKVMERIFGNRLWDHVILEVKKFSPRFRRDFAEISPRFRRDFAEILPRFRMESVFLRKHNRELCC